MYIYIIFIAFIYLTIYIGFKSKLFNYKSLSILIILIITLFASLRSDVGTDTGSYLRLYENFIFDKDSIYEKYEPGLSFLIHLFNKLNLPSFSLIIALGFIQAFLLYFIIKRSSNPLVFLSMYIGLFYFNFEFNILRAGIATLSMVLVILYTLEDKKLIAFIFAFIACIFHVSSLLFLVPFYIWRSKYKLTYLLLMVLALAFFQINSYFYDKLFFYIESMNGDDFHFSLIFPLLMFFFIFLYKSIITPSKYILYLLLLDIALRIMTMFYPIVGRLEIYICLLFVYFIIDNIKSRRISEIIILSGFILSIIVIFSFENVDRISTEFVIDGNVNTKFLPYRTIF